MSRGYPVSIRGGIPGGSHGSSPRRANPTQVLYHGTTQEFGAFDLAKAQRRDSGNLGRGVYLSGDLETAMMYAERNAERWGETPVVISVEADLGRVAVFDNLLLRALKGEGFTFPPEVWDYERSERLREWFLDRGYDSVSSSGIGIVVFDPARLRVIGRVPYVPERERLIRKYEETLGIPWPGKRNPGPRQLYHTGPVGLAPGTRLRAGGGTPGEDKAFVEGIYEDVRATFYPHRPSRIGAVFLGERPGSPMSPRPWKDEEIYEVRTRHPVSRLNMDDFTYSMTRVRPLGTRVPDLRDPAVAERLRGEIESDAHGYWRGPKQEDGEDYGYVLPEVIPHGPAWVKGIYRKNPGDEPWGSNPPRCDYDRVAFSDYRGRQGKKRTAAFAGPKRRRTVHFGAQGYEDYTMHHDPERRRRYLERHGRGREDWDRCDTAGALSRWVLWGDSTNRAENEQAFRRRFALKKVRRNPLTEDQVLEILGKALSRGLAFGGGYCGAAAMAIRDVVFGGQGELFAVANKAQLDKGRFVGHVGVMVDGTLWDAEGLYAGDEAMEDFRAWGMIDPYDPDYWPGGEAPPGAEEDTVYLRPTDEDVQKWLPHCPPQSPWEILREAMGAVTGQDRPNPPSKPRDWKVWRVKGASWNLEYVGTVKARGPRSARTAAQRRWGKGRYEVQLALRRNPGDLGLAEVTEQGKLFKTGVPVTFRFVRNTTPAPYLGSKYQQDIEPAGKFLLHQEDPGDVALRWEVGTVSFDRPLVLWFNTDPDPERFVYYSDYSWKARLAKHYGLTGVELSRALLADGYDSIVTVGRYQDPRGVRPPIFDTREIVDLRVVQ